MPVMVERIQHLGYFLEYVFCNVQGIDCSISDTELENVFSESQQFTILLPGDVVY